MVGANLADMAFSLSKLFSRSPGGPDPETLRRNRLSEYAKAIAAAEDWDAKAINFIEQRAGLPINKLDDYQSYIDAGTGGIWAVFRACHLVASTLSSAGIFVTKAGTETIIKPRPGGTDMASLIAAPNRFDTFSEMIYLTAHHLKLTGNAYWLKDEPDAAGRPKALYPLLPQYVRANPSRVDKVASYEYVINGETVKIPTEQVIHFKRPHPNNNIFGMGDIEAGASLAEDALNRNLLQEKFYANGAQPSGVLTKKEPIDSQEEWSAFRQKFNAEYGGRRNAGKVAFLNGDWSFLRLGLTSAEMESIAHSKWSIEQIFSLMGVPLSLAGLRDASNFATAKVEELNFRRYECVPLLSLIVDKLNGPGGLSMAYGGKEQVTYQLAGLIDVEQVTKEWGPLVTLGAMTLNELREKAGLARVEDPYLDQYFVNNNRLPLEMAGLVASGANNDPAAA